MKILKKKGGVIMESSIRTRMSYLTLGILIAACFFMFTGFRLPGTQEPGGSYQFYKEKDSGGVWVFEPDTGTSKYFDVEKGVVIINSFPMDTISVKTNVKTTEQKG